MNLYITEKPSQVASLTEALESNGIKNYKIVSLAGHLLSLFDLKDYGIDGKWKEMVDDAKIPFIPEKFKRKIKADSKYIQNGKEVVFSYEERIKILKPEIEKADNIILATDPDNEGATLAMSLLNFLNMENKVIGMINMSKLDLISLKKEVNIIDKIPFKSMYDAGESRAIFDWLFGINATILSTVRFGGGQLLNIGGVKLPTIRMVVERDKEFESFSEIPYYTITAKAKAKDFIFDVKIQDKEDDKFSSEEKAKNIIESIMKNKTFKVSEFLEQTKTKAPPKPFSLTDLQAESNKKYKYSASFTHDIAYKLYLELKIQSYTRTDSNHYSDGEYALAKDILSSLSQIENFKDSIGRIDLNNLLKRKIFDDSKIDAHTALSPLSSIDNETYLNLDSNQKNIFDLVANRYIMQFLADYKYLEIKGISFCEDIKILFSENIKLENGWKAIAGKDEEDKEELENRTIPSFEKDEEFEILFDSIEIKKGFTKPKPRFKEATLLQAMEKISRYFDDVEIKKFLGDSGIGTPATRANILEDLKASRNNDLPYLRLNEKGELISTVKARYLIETMPDEISSPILRAKMEEKLKLMITGEVKKEDYLNEIEKIVSDISSKLQNLDKKALEVKSESNNNDTKKVIETPKTFRLGELFIFKTFRNANITKAQAEKILNGKQVKMKLKSKEGKDYEMMVFLKDGKLEGEFAK